MTGMHLKYAAVYLCLLVTVAMSTACQDKSFVEKNNCAESAQLFWKAFRDAVQKNDQQMIVGMTQFPFRLSVGRLDADRKESVLDREAFGRVFPKLLLVDPGISDAQKSMKGYIEAGSAIPMPSKACTVDGESFRVGDWVFELKPSGWKFVRAYMDEDA